MNDGEQVYRERRHAQWLSELRRDIKRALTCARRRNYWMQRARMRKASGNISMLRFCVKYAREGNHDVVRWMGEAVKDMEFSK